MSPNAFLVAELIGFFAYRHFLVQAYTVRDGTGGMRVSWLQALPVLVGGALAMKQVNDALGGKECLINRAAWFV